MNLIKLPNHNSVLVELRYINAIRATLSAQGMCFPGLPKLLLHFR